MVSGSTSLKQQAELVVAERRMMHHAYNGLGRLEAAGTTGGVEYNALLESFLLHYRNLMDFLSPRPTARNSDVQAGHFVSATPSATTILVHRDPIDKRLSHITVQRIAVPTPKKSWNAAQMLQEIETVWGEFLLQIDREHPTRRAWFESLPGDSPTAIGIPVGSYSVVAATTSPTHITTVIFPP